MTPLPKRKKDKSEETRDARRAVDASASQNLLNLFEASKTAAAAPTVMALSMCAITVVQQYRSTLVWMQLGNFSGKAIFRYVTVSPRVPRPIAGIIDLAPTALTPAQRLSAGCGFPASTTELLCSGISGKFTADNAMMHKLMYHMARRLAAGLMATTPEVLFQQALQLYAAGKYAAAVEKFQAAAALGHLRARAEMAWLFLHGRDGVVKNSATGFRLALEGSELGCGHSKGVLGYCLNQGICCYTGQCPARIMWLFPLSPPPTSLSHFRSPPPSDTKRAMALATDSALSGSRFGQFVLGLSFKPRSLSRAQSWFELAQGQGLDLAMLRIGMKFEILDDLESAVGCFSQAAQQGSPEGCYKLAVALHHGRGADFAPETAVVWYKKAAAAGHVNGAQEAMALTRMIQVMQR